MDIIENNTAVTPVEEKETEAATVLTFSKPYEFEGKTYTEIDLAGLENLTTEDMIAAEKHLTRVGIFSPLMVETNSEYICFIASRVSGQPIEFFKGLPTKDGVKLKNRITAFFYGEG